jgi:ubiquinone biosynthesis protein
MEYIEGVSLLSVCRLSEAGNNEEIERLLPGVNLQQTISNLAREFFHELFVTGFFHGDPHPANVILRPDGSFVLIDCGIFGELAPQERRLLAKYTEALAAGNAAQSARYYAKFCTPTQATDRLAWEHDLVQVLGSWHAVLKDPNVPLKVRHMAVWQGEIAKVLRRHHVRTGANQLLVWRALMILDTTALRMPGSFDVHGAMIKFFRRNQPRVLLQLFDLFTLNATIERLQLANEIPGQMLGTLRSLKAPINEIQIRKDGLSSRERQSRLLDRYFLATLSVTFAVAAGHLAGSEPGFMIAVLLSALCLLLTVFRGR